MVTKIQYNTMQTKNNETMIQCFTQNLLLSTNENIANILK